MKNIISKVNRKILGFIKHEDAEPEAERPTTFWFYSNSKEKLHHLANHLKKDGLKIEYCGPAASIDKQLLIAEKWMPPAEESTVKLWNFFNDLAIQYGVEFDGWETRIDWDD